MDCEKISGGKCAIAHGVARVGDAWSMMILRDAGLGFSRFDEFHKSLGIAPNILTSRLAMLVNQGLLEGRAVLDRLPGDEFVLTEAGRDYLPILHALGAWTQRHFADRRFSRLVDTQSDAHVEPVVVDRATGRPTRDMALRLEEPDLSKR
ncbi:winged helix-turn-helix transcriptional regulator [Gluconacetobacter diazotrophicus]|uniref:Putative transcriptional regulator protein n=1 Tax=Gluconacetobacter diazotrophicus (strain ATCC 49037 / DSM 5601 / CCUG 37298 / CIP 103539 / LMG 7603 / PAl5) TaxID=272568 RepID=A9HD56_GLUDA|nr:helix-turn-helix domain-containing protein [Gluconacetobacter diazotrophicus]CAP55054.1 putative transcriptional regulator protein [Gluconacetobacter diazotrophicus PA1 5]